MPGLFVRLTHPDMPVGVETGLFGLAILAMAFLLTWTAEAAERDITQGFAVAILALVAVLPEYAVDLYFAWTAPGNPAHAAYAIANMTGANRLLIGLGWALVIGLFWYRTRRPRLTLGRGRFRELLFLTIATAWSFTIPLRGELPCWTRWCWWGCSGCTWRGRADRTMRKWSWWSRRGRSRRCRSGRGGWRWWGSFCSPRR